MLQPRHASCVTFYTLLRELLLVWPAPGPDIVLVSVQYNLYFDPPPLLDAHTDPHLREMREFYALLQRVAVEFVAIAGMHVEFPVEPFQDVLQQRLHFGGDLSMFRRSEEVGREPVCEHKHCAA